MEYQAIRILWSESMRYSGANQVDQKALRAALSDGNPETAFNPFGDGSNTNPATIEANPNHATAAISFNNRIDQRHR